MKKLIAYFIPEKHLDDAELYRKSKFSVAFIYFALCCTILIFGYTYSLRPDDIGNIIVGIVFPPFLVFCLWLFKRNGSFVMLANIICVFCLITIYGAPFVTGGLYSPDAYTLYIVPVLAVVLGTYRMGLVYGCLTMLGYFSYYIMDMYHVMPFRKMVDTLSPGYFLMNLVTTALFLFFLIFRNEKLRLQLVSELRGSNKMILEKNQEITDSINYGRRIQNALLPQAEAMSKLFPQSFVLYKPKDIVSGDFYWISEKGGEAFLGVADCTGHGVPGAFMSMIGTSVLNQAVNEKSISDVGLVLQDLNTGIVSSLKQNETATHDGMDIALIKLNKERNKLYYAAANRPLYLVRNNELFEHKPTKQPIGGFYMEQEKNFTVTEIELQNGDCIFLSTDGFADQFGGEKNKKMTTKNFKVLLSEMGNKTPAEQQSYLDDKFTRWKGQYEQMDDVLVVGIGI